MANDSDFAVDATPTLQQLATFLADELYSVDRIKRLENLHRNAYAEGATIAHAAQVQAAPALAEKKAGLIEEGYEKGREAIGWALAQIVAHLLGIEAPAELFSKGNLRPQDSAVGIAIAKTVLSGISGDVAELVPGDEAATRFMGMLGHLTIQSWAEGIIIEEFQSLHGLLHPIEEVSKLGKELINGMGLNRLARVAMRPLAHILVATPLDWKYKKQFRPTLLAEADIMRAFLAGDYTNSDAAEELSRLGYSDKRQAVLLKHATKYLSAADALVLVRDGTFDRDFAIENLRAQGYDQVGAQNAVLVEEGRRLENIHDDSFAAVKSAYVDRRISDAELSNYLPAIFPNESERGAHEVALRTMRDLNTKRLTATQAGACVKAGVLAIADYRAALRLEGYDEDSVLALELLLETELNKDADVEKLRAQKEAALVVEKQAKADAAAAKQAQLDEQRALARRGSLADLRRAVVTGLIPTSRYQEVLGPQYDGDTVAFLVAQVEQDRAAYLAQQQKAADALKAAALRHIDVGALQAAVLDNVITIQSFRLQLASMNFPDADADILTATLQARKADLDAAKRKQADAATAAAKKSIDLGRFEALVRAGHKTLTDYTALIRSLGYDDASVAAMVDLLNLKIAEDQKARDARAAVAAASAQKGASLEQERRAVILGNATIDDFQRWLITNKYTVDAQALLLAELRDAVIQADAARRKRALTPGTGSGDLLPLATVERAARLGVVSPDVYQARLVAAGYTPDDVAIELDLLAVEIAAVQQQRAKAAAAEDKTTDHGLSLLQLGAAVKLGEASIDDYRARAGELGYAADDVDTLVSVLTDELQTVQAAQARHATIDGQLRARNLSLSELDAAVKAGQLTIDDYSARLVALGFGSDDAELLTTLLTLKLPATPPGSAP